LDARIFDPTLYLFSSYAVPTLVAMAAILLLGLFELLRDRVSFVSGSFFLVTLTVSIWLFATSLQYLSADEATALWWAKAAYIGIPFIAPATYGFTVAVLKISKRTVVGMSLGWAIGLVFCIATIRTDLLISGVYDYWWGYYGSYGPLGLPFIAFFSTMLVASMAHYFREYRNVAPSRHKMRIRALILAFAVGYAGSVDFIPTYGIPLYPFGYLAILGFVVLAARAIWAYRLVDITPAFAAEQTIETMSEGLLVLDREGVLRVINSTACQLFGYPREELLGKRVAETINGPFFKERVDELPRLGTIRDEEMEYRLPNGRQLILCFSASVMRDRSGEPLAIVCIARDITEQKRADAEIRNLNETLEQRVVERTAELQEAYGELEKEVGERKRAQDEAQAAVRAREVLMSVVSHDLRNLLSAINGSTILVRRVIERGQVSTDGREREEPGKVPAGLVRIESAAGRMNALIGELLDFAQGQAGRRLELLRKQTDLVALARQVAAEHRQYTELHHICVEAAVPELHGAWDPARLTRVLDNLVSNAVKYSPKGGEVRVHISREEAADGAEWAVLTVRDEGIGIPERDLPYIFGWFRRAANVPGQISGTGIGLASVLQIVEEHGGTVGVKSVEGDGSIFTVRLPVGARITNYEL
jgi:PAS domain S-box-containing protein